MDRDLKPDNYLINYNRMHQKIVHIALVVKEYDEAIKFYTEKLNFKSGRRYAAVREQALGLGCPSRGWKLCIAVGPGCK
jgi:hypothetical protein